jgi:hypothetical protein
MRFSTLCMIVAALALGLAAGWYAALSPQLPQLPQLSAQGTFQQSEPGLPTKSPDFTWGAFQRFWNLRCLPGCEIENSQAAGDHYVVQYGYSVSMVARMESDYVRSLTASFSDPKGSQGGGQRWLKLVDSIIRIGVFNWPQARIAEVRKRFMEVSQQPAAYKWQISSFRRSYNPSVGWEFTLEFLPRVATDGD